MPFALLHSMAQCTGPKVLGVFVHMPIGHVHQCSFTRPFSLPLGLGFPWEWKSKSLSPVWLYYPMDCVAWPSPLGMAFSRQEYWSGLPFPSPGDLSYPGIEPRLLHRRQNLSQLSQDSTVIAEHLDFLHVTQLAFLFHHIFQKML